jgi:hypothetical protein
MRAHLLLLGDMNIPQAQLQSIPSKMHVRNRRMEGSQFYRRVRTECVWQLCHIAGLTGLNHLLLEFIVAQASARTGPKQLQLLPVKHLGPGSTSHNPTYKTTRASYQLNFGYVN